MKQYEYFNFPINNNKNQILEESKKQEESIKKNEEKNEEKSSSKDKIKPIMPPNEEQTEKKNFSSCINWMIESAKVIRDDFDAIDRNINSCENIMKTHQETKKVTFS